VADAASSSLLHAPSVVTRARMTRMSCMLLPAREGGLGVDNHWPMFIRRTSMTRRFRIRR
jgi:hypothetical protein